VTPLTVRLDGLQPDKLLAFLALLGALRSLRLARPEWSVLVRWSGADPRPDLLVDAPGLQPDDVWRAVADGMRQAATAMAFPTAEGHRRKDIDFSVAEWRAVAGSARQSADPLRMAACAALASDGVERRGSEGQVQPTPYCLMFGQGHQHFLARWTAAGEVPPGEDAIGAIASTLTERWKYADTGDSFRWDPAEDRRHALQFDDPSGTKVRIEAAANRLAAAGLLDLPVQPTPGGVVAPGVARQRRRTEYCWPLWRPWLPGRAIVALLRHPYVLHSRGARPAGLIEVRVARRLSVDKFMVAGAGVRREATPVTGAAPLGPPQVPPAPPPTAGSPGPP
jgi:hypothetical protein